MSLPIGLFGNHEDGFIKINEYLQVTVPFSPHLSSNFPCIRQEVTSGKHGHWQVDLTYIVVSESALKN